MTASEQSTKGASGSQDNISLTREKLESIDQLTCRIYMNMGNTSKSFPELYQSALKFAKASEVNAESGREFSRALAKSGSYCQFGSSDQRLINYLSKMTENICKVQEMNSEMLKEICKTFSISEYHLEKDWQATKKEFVEFDKSSSKTHQMLCSSKKKKSNKRTSSTSDEINTYEDDRKILITRYEMLKKAVISDQGMFFELGMMVNKFCCCYRQFYLDAEFILRGDLEIDNYNYTNQLLDERLIDDLESNAAQEFMNKMRKLNTIDQSMEKRLSKVDYVKGSSSQKTIPTSYINSLDRKPCSQLRNYFKHDENTLKMESNKDTNKQNRLSISNADDQKQSDRVIDKESNYSHSSSAIPSDDELLESSEQSSLQTVAEDETMDSAMQTNDSRDDAVRSKSGFWNKFKIKMSSKSEKSKKKPSSSTSNSSIASNSTVVISNEDVLPQKRISRRNTIDGEDAILYIDVDKQKLKEENGLDGKSETVVERISEKSSSIKDSEKDGEKTTIKSSENNGEIITIKSSEKIVTKGSEKIIDKITIQTSQTISQKSSETVLVKGSEYDEIEVDILEEDMNSKTGTSSNKIRDSNSIKKVITSNKGSTGDQESSNIKGKTISRDMSSLRSKVDIITYKITTTTNLSTMWASYGIQGSQLSLVTPLMFNEVPLQCVFASSAEY